MNCLELSMDCPEALKERATILQYNSLRGFQAPGTGAGANNFMICWCDDISIQELNEIKLQSNSQTLSGGDYIGRDYMIIHWSEYNKITDIFNTMLKRGHSFLTGTKGEAGFNPKIDTQFTTEIMEHKIINQCKQLIELVPRYINLTYPISETYCDIWNYTTTEGKEFCNFLREKRHLGLATYDDENNYFNWDIFKNCDYETLQTVISDDQREDICCTDIYFKKNG